MLTVRKLKILFLKHLHVIGTIMCFVYVFLFLYLNDSYNKFVHASKSSITITTSTDASKIAPKHHPNKSKLSFNKHVSHPWSDDPDCRNFTVQLADENSLPKWALTSFPGSGVTWTRQLIEGITGVYTGSIHEQVPSPVRISKENETISVKDNPFCGCTIIDNDHEATLNPEGLAGYYRLLYVEGYSEILHKTYENRGVLLLRNPMDVVFSFRNWLYSGKIGKEPPEAFNESQWENVVKLVSYVWADHAIRWIEQIEKGTVIFYEQLLGENATLELERFWEVMGFDKPIDARRLHCTLAYRNRTDHKRINKTRLPLQEEQRLMFLDSIHRVQQSLKRRKWLQLPVHLYDLHDNI